MNDKTKKYKKLMFYDKPDIHIEPILKKYWEHLLKGIVSRDWGALQIILLDRYIVGSISAEGYF